MDDFIIMLIYQIFTGRWKKKSPEVSTLADLAKRDWSKLLDLGFTTIYLMGLWEHAGPIILWEEEGRDLHGLPRVSSMMALTNHEQIDGRLGTMAELENLIDTLHGYGLKVMADFVPNHTATSHPWVFTHPEYYHHEQQNWTNFRTEFSGDVFKLNYANPELREEMIKILMTLVELKFDAVRCDMAHLVPNDFWSLAITQVKNWHAGLKFVAEAYPENEFDYRKIQELANTGFDAIYNIEFFRHLNRVLVNGEPVEYLAADLSALPNNIPVTAVNFLANHDDPPLDMRHQNDIEQRKQTWDQYREALVGTTLFSQGWPFFYNGTLLGWDHRLAHHWYEYLPEKFQETETGLTDNLIKLFKYKNELSTDDLLYEVQEGLLVIKNNNFCGLINLTPEEKPLLLTGDYASKGLIHGYELSKDKLKAGEMEIYK